MPSTMTTMASGAIVPIDGCAVAGDGFVFVDGTSSSVEGRRSPATAAATTTTTTTAGPDTTSSELLESKWMDRLRDLVRYKERHGDCNVPFQFKQDQRLANWVLKQRKHYRKGELPPRRVQRLNDVGFMWTSYRRVTWEQRFEQLRLYRKRHGTTVVSEDRGSGGNSSSSNSAALPPMDADTVALAQWVKKQRTTQRKKEMGPERVAMLNSIGFVWDVEDSSWEGRFLELVQFVKIHGTYANPKDAGLKGWVYRQRYKHHENALSEDKRQKLNAIGFQWGQPCANVGGKKNHDQRKNHNKIAAGNSQEGHSSNPSPLSSLVNACMIVSTAIATPPSSKQGSLDSRAAPQALPAPATHPEETEAPGKRIPPSSAFNRDERPSPSPVADETLEWGAATDAMELVAHCGT